MQKDTTAKTWRDVEWRENIQSYSGTLVILVTVSAVVTSRIRRHWKCLNRQEELTVFQELNLSGLGTSGRKMFKR